jgi:hypothetical protein
MLRGNLKQNAFVWKPFEFRGILMKLRAGTHYYVSEV